MRMSDINVGVCGLGVVCASISYNPALRKLMDHNTWYIVYM